MLKLLCFQELQNRLVHPSSAKKTRMQKLLSTLTGGSGSGSDSQTTVRRKYTSKITED
jgi:hypothetical protein